MTDQHTDSRAGLTTIRRRRSYRHAPGLVWQALTRPELLSRWLMATTDFSPVVGAEFRFTEEAARGWSGRVRGLVLDAEPPARLAYRWQADDDPDVTTVTWTLHPTPDGGTSLTLVHAGFRRHPRSVLTRAFLDLGWRSMLRRALPAAIQAASSTD
jgi:uncharacterized protein YndB with AHSA1/START domain